jgi:hypothetical protein
MRTGLAPFRGSRKHVLDWTSTPEFCVELLRLVQPVNAHITTMSSWMPRGYDAVEEARLETFGPTALPHKSVWSALRSWWLAHELERSSLPPWLLLNHISYRAEGT